MIVFKTTKDYPELAVGEIESMTKQSVTELKKGWYLSSADIIPLNRLGLTKTVYSVLAVTNKEDYIEKLVSIVQNKYKITVIDGPKTIDVADTLYRKLDSPDVDVTHPDHHYILLFGKDVFILEELYVNNDTGMDRRAHEKAKNHPTSMHPKIARAMINLAGSDSFYDPFCGAGGFLIEGCLMGLSVRGSDIDRRMVWRALENTKAFGLDIRIEEKDALAIQGLYESIITDFPYGRNSKASKDLSLLYREFFVKAQDCTTKLVVGMADGTDYESLLQNTSWTVKKMFVLYVHGTLSRRILVLVR